MIHVRIVSYKWLFPLMIDQIPVAAGIAVGRPCSFGEPPSVHMVPKTHQRMPHCLHAASFIIAAAYALAVFMEYTRRA